MLKRVFIIIFVLQVRVLIFVHFFCFTFYIFQEKVKESYDTAKTNIIICLRCYVMCKPDLKLKTLYFPQTLHPLCPTSLNRADFLQSSSF